ncbi:MAG: S-layer homology domain-containing protein [Bacillota bacterium]|nr:S-layer homology domain-containing protein [Bacillota bacterium]
MKRKSLIKGLKLLLAASIILSSLYTSTIFSYAAFSVTADTKDPNKDTQISLSWDSVPNAYYYEIDRTEAGGSAVKVKTTNVNSDLNPFSYTDIGLTPDTSYTYTIKALSAVSVVLDTAVSSSIKTDPMNAPVIKSSIYDINSGSVSVSWTNTSLATTGNTISSSILGSTPVTVQGGSTSYTYNVSGSSAFDIYLCSTDSKGHSSANATAHIVPITVPVLTSSIANGTATISWDGASVPNIQNFVLERSKYGSSSWGTWSQVGTSNITSGSSSIADSPTGGGVYRYRLHAVSGGYTGYSNITNSVTVPIAPTALTATLASLNSTTMACEIDLSWTNDPYNVSNLVIQRSTDGFAANSVDVATLTKSSGAFQTAYADKFTAVSGATYTYRIVAYDSNSNRQISATAQTATSTSNAPTSLKLTLVSAAQFDLSWSFITNNEQGFRVERKTEADASYPSTALAILPPNTTSYSDKTATPGHTYTYRVSSYNAMGISAPTNEVTATTTDLYTPNTLTIVPASSTELDLNWTYPIQKACTTIIERSVTPSTGSSWQTIATIAYDPSSSSNGLSYKDTGLLPNTQYYYRIRAVKSSNPSASPVVYDVQSLTYPINGGLGKGAETYLNTPIITSVTQPSSTQAVVTWNGNNSGVSGLTGYVIERKKDSEDYSVMVVASPGTTSWTDTTVKDKTLYTYRIKAQSNNNSSLYSNEMSNNFVYSDYPSDLTYKVNPDYTVKLSWKDNSKVESEYEVWKMSSTSTTWYQCATLPANTTSYVDTLTPNVTYYYMVRYHKASDNTYSPYIYSGAIIINQPYSPSYLYCTLYNNNSSAVLSWTYSTGYVQGYKLERKTGYGDSWITVSTLSSGITYYYDQNLAANTQYFYRVSAFYTDSSNNVFYSPSNIIEVNTGVKSPVNLTCQSLASDTVKLSWESTAQNVAGFRVERRTSLSSSSYTPIATLSSSTNTYTDNSASPGTQYIYRVAAYTNSGTTAYSGEVVATTKYNSYFNDVGYSFWAYTAVQDLASRGVIKGKSGNNFKPNSAITRAEFVSLMVRAFNINKTPLGTFKDVTPDKWFYTDIMAAKSMGIISGSNGYFYPNRPVTREDMAVIVAKTLKAIEKPLPGHSNSVLVPFPDSNQISSYAVSNVCSLIGENIISGKPQYGMNFIKPGDNLTRAEAATIIYKIIDI